MQLVGRKVAYEQGTTSDLLIHYLLRSKGIPFNAIQVVNAPAADAGTLLIAGKVDVAVTYEPYISNALSANGGTSGAHVLYSSKDAPGLISDFLTTRSDWLSTHKEAARRLILAWNDAMNYFATNRTDAIAIMADGVGAKPSDLTATLAGVKIFTVAENQSLYHNGELAREYQGVGDTLAAQGTIQAPVPFDQVVDFSVQQ
jgi:NitT/TauT family transport system substrate-binding protein